MASNALKQITTRAKKIRKSSKGMSWKAAVKKAGAEYRSKKGIGKGDPKHPSSGNNYSGPGTVTVQRKGPIKKTPGQRAPGLRVGSSVGSSVYTVRDQMEKQIQETVSYIEKHKRDKGTGSKLAVKKSRKLLSSLRKQLRQQNSIINQMLR